MGEGAAPRAVSAVALRAMLADGEELALLDVREELIFSESHLLWARSLPLSRLELRIAALVPRLATRIVLCDAGEGLAERAANVLTRHGYTDVAVLDGGIDAWEAAGFALFSGVNVPSKAFGEFVEHDSGTPSIDAAELDALLRSRADVVVLDSRPFDEYARVSIPTATNVPGAELVLRVRDVAPSPRDDGGGQLRRPHPQHHRRAVADQRRRAQQGGGAAQRHHGLEPCRADLRERQGDARAGAFGRNAGVGESGRRQRRGPFRRRSRSTAPRWSASAPTRRARSISSTSATRPSTRPVMWQARFRRPADNWCRRPTSMPGRSARASCWSTTRRCAR